MTPRSVPPRRRAALPGLAAAVLSAAVSAHAAVTGQWDFNGGDLAATTGQPLQYADGAGGATQAATSFGTTTSFGLPDIGGVAANVMRFGTNTLPAGFSLPNPAAPNGGGSQVNQWTLLMDVLYTGAAHNHWRAILETDNGLTQDADFFINPGNGLGISGSYSGQILSNTWHRIAFVVDTPLNEIRKYIDGVEVGRQPAGGASALDGRWALAAGGFATLFADDDGETSGGYVNSIQLHDAALSKGQLAALGGPTAAGLPTSLPPVPSSLDRWIPGGPVASRTTDVGAVLDTGDAVIQTNTVTLTLDGAAQSGVVLLAEASKLTVRKTPDTLLGIGSRPTVVLSYVETLAGQSVARAFTNQFDVALFFEDFNGVPLGPNVEEASAGEAVWTKTPPAGWSIDDTGMPGFGTPEYPENDGRTEWAGWSFADVKWWPTVDDQMRSQFTRASGAAAIADPDEWDDAPHLVGFFNSLLLTPAIPLAGIAPNTAVLRFDSSWRPEAKDDGAPNFPVGPAGELLNNQTAVIRASYDGGAPIEILRWQSDPALPNFKPDAVNEAVSVLLNNPPGATNLVLTFGLIESANDWWWAIDNLAITVGDVAPVITRQPASTTRILGSLASLSVEAGGTNLRYQWRRDGEALTGATNAVLSLGPLTRADGGRYVCVVSNSAGTATSDAAVVTVLDVPADAASLKLGLAVYLPFEDSYADASGNNLDGAAVGSPTFAPGKVGRAVRVSNSRADSTFNFVTLGSNADLSFGQTNDFTVAFWARAERTAGDPSIIANKDWDSGGNTGWTIGTQGDGRIEWNYKRSDATRKDLDYTGRGNLLNNTSTWAHIVVVWRINGQAETYHNGELVNSTSIAPGSGDLANPALALNLGQDGTGAYGSGEWDGLLDDVAIWNRALNPDEVLTLYTFGEFGDNFFTAPAVTAGLAVNLRFEGDLLDSSGAGNHGTAVGSPAFAQGRVGQGVRLNTQRSAGAFSYVTLGNAPPVRFGATQDFTVVFWAKMNAWSSDPAFIANKDWGSGSNEGWVIATDGDGRIQWNYRRRNPDSPRKDYDSPGGFFSDLAWHHVAVVFRVNGQSATYFDGNELTLDRDNNPARKDLTPATGTLFDLARRLNVGQDGTGQYSDAELFDALMDDVSLWSRALSGREVAVLYNRGLNNQQVDGSEAGGGAPTLAYSVAGGQLTLNWTGEGFTLEENAALGGGAWTPVAGAGPNAATVSLAGGPKFFRLRK